VRCRDCNCLNSLPTRCYDDDEEEEREEVAGLKGDIPALVKVIANGIYEGESAEQTDSFPILLHCLRG
jgi:hypothetical protein